jgi:hypothetical protein
MAISINVPYLTYDNIRVEADRFLKNHHPDGGIPVPIEKIVDNDFEVNSSTYAMACSFFGELNPKSPRNSLRSRSNWPPS